MPKRLRWRDIAPVGPGLGHTDAKPLPGVEEFALPPNTLLEPGTRAYRIGPCKIFVSHSRFGWHMSISHPKRYPSWDEIAKARYALLPGDISMALMLPPQEEFINIHTNCFQLWQVRDIHSQEVIELGVLHEQAS